MYFIEAERLMVSHPGFFLANGSNITMCRWDVFENAKPFSSFEEARQFLSELGLSFCHTRGLHVMFRHPLNRA